MRFFDRAEELASLREIRRTSKDNAQFTVVTGRRRVGKTYLIWKAYEDEPILSFTGGVAKYVQLLVDAGATTKSAMLDHIIKADSIFLGEGKAILIEEFGKDYGVYFSILSAIVSINKCVPPMIRAKIQKSVNGTKAQESNPTITE